jgi:GntR family phosphonate transport system transcriptional regulator
MTPDLFSLVLPASDGSFWVRIAHEIAQAIRHSIYAPGERLPSEHALAQMHGVNRHTIRRSLSALHQLGLLRPARGSGTYVEEFAVDLLIGKRTSYRQNLAQAGLKGGMRVLASLHEPAEDGVAQALQLSPEDEVLHLVVLGEGGGQSLHFSDRFFPLPRFRELGTYLEETGSLTEAFARLGIADYSRRQSRISARLPSAQVAEYLHQPPSRPTLLVCSVNVDTDGHPIEYARTWFAGDRVTLIVDHEQKN